MIRSDPHQFDYAGPRPDGTWIVYAESDIAGSSHLVTVSVCSTEAEAQQVEAALVCAAAGK